MFLAVLLITVFLTFEVLSALLIIVLYLITGVVVTANWWLSHW